jgi:hypothetical protein
MLIAFAQQEINSSVGVMLSEFFNERSSEHNIADKSRLND